MLLTSGIKHNKELRLDFNGLIKCGVVKQYDVMTVRDLLPQATAVEIGRLGPAAFVGSARTVSQKFDQCATLHPKLKKNVYRVIQVYAKKKKKKLG